MLCSERGGISFFNPLRNISKFLHSVLWQLIAIIWQKQKRRWQIKQSKFTTKLLHNNRNAVIY
jgi:hypothetical protein